MSEENSYLNKRCSELILQVAESNDQIRVLREAMRDQMPEARSSLEHRLKDELAAVKNDLLKEQQRSQALEDQLRRATSGRVYR